MAIEGLRDSGALGRRRAGRSQRWPQQLELPISVAYAGGLRVKRGEFMGHGSMAVLVINQSTVNSKTVKS